MTLNQTPPKTASSADTAGTGNLTYSGPVPSRREQKLPSSTGQVIAAVIVLLFVAWLLYVLAENPNIDYDLVLKNLTHETILMGLVNTLFLTAISMAIGIVLGLVIAVAKMSGNRVLAFLADAYIWFFRGVPLMVQVLIWGNFGLLFPQLGLGIPFTDIVFFSVPTNSVITIFVASILALSLHEASYMAEVVRGGIASVDRGQAEASKALGMSQSLSMRRVILPQALRLIIPPTGNQLITLLKGSALIMVIAGGELMTAAHDLAAIDYRTVESLIVATFWYLVIVTVLSVFQSAMERRLSKGVRA